MLKKIQNIDLIKLFHKRLIDWEPIFGNQQQQQQQQQTVRILTKLRLGPSLLVMKNNQF